MANCNACEKRTLWVVNPENQYIMVELTMKSAYKPTNVLHDGVDVVIPTSVFVRHSCPESRGWWHKRELARREEKARKEQEKTVDG